MLVKAKLTICSSVIGVAISGYIELEYGFHAKLQTGFQFLQDT